jgi:hypothetical protein
MDTVLNVGINDDIAMQLSQEIGPRFAYDTYARFLMSYGITVMGEDPQVYLDIIHVTCTIDIHLLSQHIYRR